MKKNKNVPKLRFPGFADAWEQRKLDELATFSKGSGYSKGDLKDSGTPIILYGRLYTKYETVITSVDTFAEPKKGSVYSSGGEVIVPASGETAEDISVASVVKNAGVLLGGDLNVITPSKDLDSPFLAISISNGKPHNDMAKMAQGKSVVHLHNSDLAKIELPYPSRDEQVRISSFFSEIDNLIALHQRKCDEVKKLKKSMLQKMFPKDGEQFPEIRFPGFTDAWEQRKLSELLEKYEDPVETPHDGYERLGLRSHAKGTFHSYVEPGKELDTAKMHRVASDKFILNITFAWEHAVAITDENDAGKLVSHRFPQFSFDEKLKSHFFKYLMLDRRFREHLELSSPGGAGRNKVLKINEMLKYEIRLPSIDEQNKIGAFFDELDNLIALHQCQRNKLKDLKRALLQQMFI